MKWCSMDLGEGVHSLNLLCGANLQDELRIAMREIESDDPEVMYEHAKNVSKKYFGKSAITGKWLQTSRDFIISSIIPKQETLFSSVDEYESYIEWKKDNIQKFSIGSKHCSFYGKKNPNGCDGKPLKCHVWQPIGHFVNDCPYKYRNRKPENKLGSPNRTWVAQIQTSDIYECDTSDIYVAESLNYMILDTGCPQNVGGLVWFNCFIDSLSDNFQKLLKLIVQTSLNLVEVKCTFFIWSTSPKFDCKWNSYVIFWCRW